MNKIVSFLLLLTYGTALAAGVDTKFNSSDRIQFGVASATSSKSIVFNTNDGSNNVTVLVDDSRNVSINTNGTTALKSDAVTIGSGIAGNKSLKFDVGSGGSNPGFRYDLASDKLLFRTVGAPEKSIGSGSGSGGGVNLLQDSNADFETYSTVFANWTGSTPATITQATTGANLLIGSSSAVFNATTTGQTFTSDAVNLATSPIGRLAGTTGGAFCSYKTTANDYKIQVIAGGSTIISEAPIPASSGISQANVPTFTFPASGTVQLRISSQSNAADIAIDNCHLGTGGLFELSESKLAVDIRIPAAGGCSWTHTNSGSPSDFDPNASCVAPLVTASNVGTWSTVDADLPQFTATNLPAGTYSFIIVGLVSNDGAAGNVLELGVNDGTSQLAYNRSLTHGPTSGDYQSLTVTGSVTYTTAQNSRTFKLQGTYNNGTNITLYNEGSETRMLMYYSPTSSGQAQRIDTVAQSWSGYYNGCQFSRNSTTFGPVLNGAACVLNTLPGATNLGSVTPEIIGPDTAAGITFTPNSNGKYEVCSNSNIFSGSSAFTMSLALTTDGGATFLDTGNFSSPGSNFASSIKLCAHVVASSTSPVTVSTYGRSTIAATLQIDGGVGSVYDQSWTIKKMDQQEPAPLVANGVVTGSSSVERLERARISGNPSCAIISASGGITASAVAGSGCQVTFSPPFAAGEASCTCSVPSGNAEACRIVGGDGLSTMEILTFATATGTPVGSGFHLICMGAR